MTDGVFWVTVCSNWVGTRSDFRVPYDFMTRVFICIGQHRVVADMALEMG